MNSLDIVGINRTSNLPYHKLSVRIVSVPLYCNTDFCKNSLAAGKIPVNHNHNYLSAVGVRMINKRSNRCRGDVSFKNAIGMPPIT